MSVNSITFEFGSQVMPHITWMCEHNAWAFSWFLK